MNEMEPLGVHDFEHKKELEIFRGMVRFVYFDSGGIKRLAELAEEAGNLLVEPHKLDM